MEEIALYNRETIDQLEWPNTKEGDFAKRYLLPLIIEGPEAFIANAKTELYILKIDDIVLPISVNEKEYQNSYLLSSYFCVANLSEKLEKKSLVIRWLSKPWIGFLGGMLKLMKINKTVIVNNWLLSVNLYPSLNKEQISCIKSFLEKRFPDHYFMLRSINTYKGSQLFNYLDDERFRMIPCRHIYLYDPSRKSQLTSHEIRKQTKDKNRISKRKYEIQSPKNLTQEEMTRLLELYKSVYMSKYTKYSPAYTDKFLKHAIETGVINFKLLKKEGKIYGVSGFLQNYDYITIPFFGYDTNCSQEEGLYRMLSAVITQEVESANVVSHQGSGAGQFKKWRGLVEEVEYVAIYDRHLPFVRRLFWSLGEIFSSRFFKKKAASM